jgi:hypothetical protein
MMRLTRLSPLACRYHSFTLSNVDFLERSNMKNIATASLQTNGSILKNSRCPPRSQMLNVISVLRRTTVFSRKLTPARKDLSKQQPLMRATGTEVPNHTKRLNIVFVKFVLNVFDHERCFSNLLNSVHKRSHR